MADQPEGMSQVAVTSHAALRALAAASAEAAELDRILRGRELRAVFQPIVELERRRVVGYEALARGPAGSPLERPDALFAAARTAGRLIELEWACRMVALRAALSAGLRRPFALFLNVEPDTLGARMPEEARALVARVRRELHVVLELTERALADRPADILGVLPRLRAAGDAIALDDVGADRRSLALMPFVAPDVVKLDLRLVQENPSPQIAAIVHAVNAQAERQGTRVLAEGVETEAQHGIALALGATYGQGWLYGRPGPLPDAPVFGADRPLRLDAATAAGETPGATPFELVRARHAPRKGSKRLLLQISKHLEAHVLAHADAAVVMATFQDARHLTAPTRRRYRELAERAALVGALGVGFPPEPVPGVRGAALDPSEPLCAEWNVVVVDSHFAAAFVASDLGDRDGPDMDRQFAFCLTYDRDLVLRAARSLMGRLAPAAGEPR